MEERPCDSEEGAEGAHDYRVMVPAPGRHDGHHAWPGSGTREAMMPAQGTGTRGSGTLSARKRRHSEISEMDD